MRLGVLTSGGDAPGMNSVIRAVVRAATAQGLEVYGLRRGYQGLIEGDLLFLDNDDVGNIVHLGGTILQTSRSKEFETREGREKAALFLKESSIDYLVTIGGEGTCHGAALLAEEHQVKVVNVAATIDNDVFGTDYTVGFDTAVNTAVQAIDKIRDTALSLDRLFFIEVMGRATGFIALEAGIASGAVEALLPEVSGNVEELCYRLESSFRRGSHNCIVVVGEGNRPGRAFEVAKAVMTCSGLDSRVCVLGHIQRGGAPTARDRVLASKLGAAAVDALLHGEYGVVVGEVKGEVVRTPLRDAYEKKKPLNSLLLEILRLLSD